MDSRYIGGDILIKNRSFLDLNDPDKSLSQKTEDIILEIKGVESISPYVIKNCSIFLEKEKLDKHSDIYNEEAYRYAFNNLYYTDGFVAIGMKNLPLNPEYIEEDSSTYSQSYGAYIQETLNNSRDPMYPDVLHVMITSEESEFTGLAEGDYFAIVYSIWDEDADNYIGWVANAKVSNIIEHKLPFLFMTNGGFPSIYFDIDELRDFTESNGFNHISITLTEDADKQQVIKNLSAFIGDEYSIETHDDLLTSYKMEDSKKLMLELIVLLLTSIIIITGSVIASLGGLAHRKRELLIYYAIGISRKEILRMILHENFIYLVILIPVLALFQGAFVVYNWYLYNQVSINLILVVSYIMIDFAILLLVVAIGKISTKHVLHSDLILATARED